MQPIISLQFGFVVILLHFPNGSVPQPTLDFGINPVPIPWGAGPVYSLSHEPDDVQFYLFSNPENADEAKEIIFNDTDSLQKSGFVSGRRSVFIVHGFHSNIFSEMPQVLKNAFLEANANQSFDHNIIVVNWGPLSIPIPLTMPQEMASAFYTEVTLNVPIVAERLADFALFLLQQNVVTLSSVYLIGHSLGSHVSGLAGRDIFLATGKKIGRITGLDPAGPDFFQVAEKGLAKGDAMFVDVIHTNLGILGSFTNDGHADFYPNGGSLQPGCLEHDNTEFTSLGHCSHRYAYILYAASLKKRFLACPCDMVRFSYPQGGCSATCENPEIFGYHSPSTASGEFFLVTSNPP